LVDSVESIMMHGLANPKTNLDLGTRWRIVTSFTPWMLYSRERTAVPIKFSLLE
jgi:hypothetical protein